MEFDISKVVKIEGQVEKPIKDNFIDTLRPSIKNTETTNVVNQIESISSINVPVDIFDEDIEVISDIDTLKKFLSDVIVRFDTSPRNYLKEDYLALLKVIYKSLLHIYANEAHDLVTEWSNPLRNDAVPSEKLVKDTIDSLQNDVDGSIYATNAKLNSEITNRELAINDLYDDLFPLIAAGL